MDDETKQLLRSLCAVLQDLTEHAFHAHDMAEKVHDASCRTVETFGKAYESSTVLLDGHTIRSKKQIQDALAKVVQQLS